MIKGSRKYDPEMIAKLYSELGSVSAILRHLGTLCQSCHMKEHYTEGQIDIKGKFKCHGA